MQINIHAPVKTEMKRIVEIQARELAQDSRQRTAIICLSFIHCVIKLTLLGVKEKVIC